MRSLEKEELFKEDVRLQELGFHHSRALKGVISFLPLDKA